MKNHFLQSALLFILINFSTKAQTTLWEVIDTESKKLVSTYTTYTQNFTTWSTNAGQNFADYTTSSGVKMEQFAKEAESKMNSTAKNLIEEFKKASTTLKNITNLECTQYIAPVRSAIKNIPTPLDNYGGKECTSCLAFATEEFLCQIPKIFEGNVALVKKLNDAIAKEKTLQPNATLTEQTATAMAKLIYSDFSESLQFILTTKDKLLSQGNITPTQDHLKILYSEENCRIYGNEAMGFLLDKITAENPKTRIQRLTNKLIEILGKMDAANNLAANIQTISNYVKTSTYRSQTEQLVPDAATLFPGGVKIGTGWNRFETITASNNGYLYGIEPNGDLYGYSHLDAKADKWESNKIGAGWNIYSKVFAGNNRTVYAIDHDGVLWWYENYQPLTSSGWHGRNKIGAGWQIFRHVIAGSDGMIYPIQSSNNNMLWYQNTAPAEHNWHPNSGKKAIGTGWDEATVKHVLAGQDGVIYLVRPDGNLYWYLNTKPGEMSWSNDAKGLLIDTGWDKYSYVFGGKDNILYGVTPNGDLYRHDFNR